MTTDTVTYQLSLSDGVTTYTDEITLVKVREGSDAVTGLLTNEACTVPADYLGNITSWAGISGNFKVYQGSNDVTTACTYAVAPGGNPDGVTVSIGATTGAYAVTGNWPAAKDATTVTFRATFGTTTIDKVFSITRAKAGSTASILVLTSTAQAFTYDSNGNANPTSQTITFTANLQNLAGTATFTCTLYNASGVSIGTPVLGGTGNTRTLTSAQFGTAQYAVVVASLSGQSDQETVVKLKDGANNITGYLTNEACTVAADSSGNVPSYAGTGGTFKVFNGLTDMTGNAAVTYSLVSSSGLTASIASTGVYTLSAMTADTATATFRAVYNGVTIDKVYNLAKSKAGASGSGTPGVRGSRTFYVALSGSSSTWSDSLATTAASVDGGPVKNDLVVEYNNSVGFSQTKFWDGSVWQLVAAAIDGNLIVTGTVGANALSVNSVSTNTIQANAVTAAKIDSTGLTLKDTNGNVIIGAGVTSVWRVVSSGYSGAPAVSAGLYRNGASIEGAGRSYNLARIRRSDGQLVFFDYYDIYGSGAAAPGALNGGTLTDALNASGNDVIVVLWTYDEPQANRTGNNLPAAIYRCGGSPGIFLSSRFYARGAYLLVGIGGCGQGNGIEQLAGSGNNSTDAWIDLTFNLLNGGVVAGAKNTTPEINSSNVSTYIAGAAIGYAQIGSVDAGTITVGQLVANQIKAGEVTAIQEASTNFNLVPISSSASTVQQTYNIISATTTGAPVKLMGTASLAVFCPSTTAYSVTASVDILMDGAEADSTLQAISGDNGVVRGTAPKAVSLATLPLFVRNIPSAGSHTWSARVTITFLDVNGNQVPAGGSASYQLTTRVAVEENKV
jgi:hypothetical protein